jgi:diguanylate cyclase (GGDEF)-like protein/PAS domain S-box-containing protein
MSLHTMITSFWRRFTSGWHFSPHLVVLMAGSTLTIFAVLGFDAARGERIAFAVSGLLASAALAALVRWRVQREVQSVIQAILETLPNPVYFKGTDGRYNAVNGAWEALTGIERSAVIGKSAQELDARHQPVAGQLTASEGTLCRQAGFRVHEDVIQTAGGARHDAIVCKATCVHGDGRIFGLMSSIVDITDRKRVERRLAMEHAITRVLAEAASLDEVVPTIIKTICEMTDWDYGALYRHHPQSDVLRCEQMWGVDMPNIRAFMAEVGRRVVHAADRGERGLVRRTLALGKPVWISDIAADQTLRRRNLVIEAGLHGAFAFPLKAGNEVLGILEFLRSDVLGPDPMLLEVAESIGTQIGQYIVRRRAETDKHLAMHDVVTGLPNRFMFSDRLEQAIARARRHERALAVMFIDLDRFKEVNDSLGHEAGDLLLREISKRLTLRLRAGDTVARWGGDEFVMLLEDIAGRNDMQRVGQQLIRELAAPYTITGKEVTVTASIGVSTFPADGLNGASLLRLADGAMYSAKGKGRNLCELHIEGAMTRQQTVLRAVSPRVDTRR